MYRRRFKRKFRALEKHDPYRLVTFIPRRMDLLPDAIKIKLPRFFRQEMCLVADGFPLPVMRSIPMWNPGSIFTSRGVVAVGPLGNDAPDFPNSHYSIENPIACTTEYLGQLSRFYRSVHVNGAKAHIDVALTSNIASAVSSTDATGTAAPGIGVDCWIGCPQESIEWDVLEDNIPEMAYLRSPYDLLYDSTVPTVSQWHPSVQLTDTSLIAKHQWGNPMASPSTALWGAQAVNGTRKDWTWFMKQTAQEKPWAYKHGLIYVASPEDSRSYKHNKLGFKGVYNPQLYWRRQIFEFLDEESAGDPASMQAILDDLKALNLADSGVQTDANQTSWRPDTGAVAATTVPAPIAQQIGVTSGPWAPTINGNYDPETLKFVNRLPHIWMMLVPRYVGSNRPDLSYTWPYYAMTDFGDDTAFSAKEAYGSIKITTVCKVKYYCILRNLVSGFSLDDVFDDGIDEDE